MGRSNRFGSGSDLTEGEKSARMVEREEEIRQLSLRMLAIWGPSISLYIDEQLQWAREFIRKIEEENLGR